MEFLSLYWWRILVIAVISYLLGSLSFAVIFSKAAANKQDVREMGSGNAGFTNVLRCVGIGPAVLTFIFDLLKGIIPVMLAVFIMRIPLDMSGILQLPSHIQFEYNTYLKYIAGLLSIIGHCFPVFFGFRGGKGVTTTAGVALMLDVRLFAMAMSMYLIILLITKIVSVSSLVAAVAIFVSNFIITFFWMYLPSQSGSVNLFWSHFVGGNTEAPLRLSYVIVTSAIMLAVSLLVIIKHKDNIKRLIRGEEKKIKAKKKTDN